MDKVQVLLDKINNFKNMDPYQNFDEVLFRKVMAPSFKDMNAIVDFQISEKQISSFTSACKNDKNLSAIAAYLNIVELSPALNQELFCTMTSPYKVLDKTNNVLKIFAEINENYEEFKILNVKQKDEIRIKKPRRSLGLS